MDNWAAWIPLIVLSGAIVIVEVLSLVLDPGFRLRRELRRKIGGVVHGIAKMEVRGIRVHQLIGATEEVRGKAFIQHALIWILVLALSALAVVFSWLWWVVPLIAGLAIGAQTIDPRGLVKPSVAADLAQPDPSRVGVRRLVHGLAIALTVIGVVLLGLGTAPNSPLDTGLILRLGALTGGIVLLMAAILVRRAGLRVQGSAATRFGADSSRDDILLLRSFRDDMLHIRAIDVPLAKLGVLLGYRTRFEELIATTLLSLGRLIAIGKPGEPVPPLGATRTYVADDRWQEEIENTARRVGMIVMIAAGTRGFEWELGLLRRLNLLHKALILLPPFGLDMTLDRLQDLLQRLGIDVLEGIDGEPFDDWGFIFISTVTGIGFTAQGRPIFYLTLGRDWLGYTATALRAFAVTRGRLQAPLHGEFARSLGYEVDPAEQ